MNFRSAIEQTSTVVTPIDAAHGGLGVIAVLNGLWLDYLNPLVLTKELRVWDETFTAAELAGLTS